MIYLVSKSLHIVGFVSWFAGLFYIVRLFIYHNEALENEHGDAMRQQFQLMSRRLWYGITWPAAIFTVLTGTVLMIMTQAWTQPWFHGKLTLLICLFAYHLYCGVLLKSQVLGRERMSSKRLRIYNECATVLLLAIVFMVVLKDMIAVAIAVGVGIALISVMFVLYHARQKKMDADVSSSGVKNLNG